MTNDPKYCCFISGIQPGCIGISIILYKNFDFSILRLFKVSPLIAIQM
jgi:hypothetical protein